MKRKLGNWETLHALVHDEAQGHGIITSCARISAHLDPELIKRTFHHLTLRHPLLSAVISDEDEQFFFIKNTSFKLPITVQQREYDTQWMHLLTHQSCKPFDTKNALWRLYILLPKETETDTDIILAVHHSICDGLVAVTLLQEFFGFYHRLKQGEKPNVEKLGCIPALDETLPIRKKLNSLIDVYDQKQLTKWKYHNTVPLAQRNTGIVCRQWGGNKLKRLQQKCDQKKVSLHSALNAALLMTAQQQRESTISVVLNTPIDLRRFCRPKLSNQHFGCYTTILPTYHTDIDQSCEFWSLAKAYQQKLRTAVRRSNFHPTQFDRPSLKYLIQELCLNQNTEFTFGYGITNGGKLTFDTHGEGHIKFIYACPARKTGDFVILLTVLCINDELFLTFAYTAPLLDRHWVEKFATDFIEQLTRDLNSKHYNQDSA